MVRRLELGSAPLAIVLVTFACARPDRPDPAPTPEASYVGRVACAECHGDEAKRWSGSHHDLAMQEPSAETVLGDFADAAFTADGVSTRFQAREGRFFARTEGPAGETSEYEVAYVFGVEPLQQYLVGFPDGRYQALRQAWDSRPEQEGGQRWIHLYPGERILPDDVLHWTGRNQNWNFMCSECHSTNLKKGYDVESDRFDTTWAEIDVSCESCHGPGSNHARWARGDKTGEDGLVVRLKEEPDVRWDVDPASGNATRHPARQGRGQVELCARCHSRRSLVSEDYVHGRPLMDTHRPALLRPPIYHTDGQIRDEVYAYGSFLQSKMSDKGVTCSDCHDPHSLEVYSTGNALCGRCHLAEKYDSEDHHHHQSDSRGSACVDCHMPERLYMVVDWRRDHSFRVPRPDLSARLSTPNACNDCHDDRSSEWAAGHVEGWFGDRRPVHYAEALATSARGGAGSADATLGLAMDPAGPPIVRATALERLGRFQSPEALGALERALGHTDPLLRLAGVTALESFDPRAALQLLLPLLDDPVRVVRLEAARVLGSVPREQLNDSQRSAIHSGLRAYIESQQVNADRGETHLNIGVAQIQLGNLDEAQRAYERAIERARDFIPGYVNLADLHRLRGRDDAGEEVLHSGLALAPDHPDLNHALGLLLIRTRRFEDALEPLGLAAAATSGGPGYSYVYGVALESAGRKVQAFRVLRDAHERFPEDLELLMGLIAVARSAGERRPALDYARKLAALTPADPNARQLIAQLEAEIRRR